VKKELDEKWLIEQAGNEESRNAVKAIIQQRQEVYAHNRFYGGDALNSLILGRYRIWYRECSGFSTLEVYHEIFREDNHFLLPEFSGKEETVILDIGANEGFYALKIKEHNPDCRLVCVEPNPYLFEVLQRNLASNQIRNVSTVNKALAAEKGTVHFELIKQIGPIGGRDLKLVNRPWLKEEFIQSIEVETETLNDLLRRFGIKQTGILKVDVEGMELDVLAGARDGLEEVDKIVIERHNKALRDGVVDFLHSRHFRLVYEEDPEITQYYGDLYFIRQR